MPNKNNYEEKVFDRQIKVGLKTRLRAIRKTILEQIGVEDICTARLFKVSDTKRPAPLEEDKEKVDAEEEP